MQTGSPPCTASAPSAEVIFDGVLYDRESLAALLDAPAADDDAALVLKAYARWGDDLLHRIKGIFALILWDRDRQTLLCARDPMGVYPLYYSDTGRELALSTSIDALLQHPSASRAVNRAALADHLLHRWPDVEETFYEKVRRVPPGHAMQVDQTGRRSYRYWDPVPPGQPVNWIREDELDSFDTLLAQAVQRCLAFGPAAIFLSGGLDSVSVAAVAAQESRRLGLPSPWALSLDFPEPDQSEAFIQTRVAAELELPQDLVPFEEAVGSQGLLPAALEMTSQWPLPLLNAWGPAYFQLGLRARRYGCGVILTGGGGDEWLGISPLFSADLLRALDLKGLYRFWQSQQRSYQVSRLLLARILLWSYGLRPLLRDAALRTPGGRLLQRMVAAVRRRTSHGIPDWVAPDPGLRRELDRRARQVSYPERIGSHYLHDVRTCLDHPLPSWELEEYFENGRRLGLPVLHPFFDAELADFLYRTPPRFLNAGERSKGLVRQFLARQFPSLGFENQKKDVSSNFFRLTMLQQGHATASRLGWTKALAAAGIVHPGNAERLITDILASRSMKLTFRIWDILNLEAWLRPRLS